MSTDQPGLDDLEDPDNPDEPGEPEAPAHHDPDPEAIVHVEDHDQESLVDGADPSPEQPTEP